MAETETPREIVLEARNDGQNLDLLQRVFQSSKIKAETVSSDPIKIKIPATTRAVSVLLLLLDELKPEGNVILDNGNSYGIDKEGLSKLRRIAIKSLSDEVPEKNLASARPRQAAMRVPVDSNQPRSEARPEPVVIGSRGFKSNEISLLTMMFSVLIGVVATFVTLLAILGKIGEIYSVFILGACVIGVFSIMHRYVASFKESRS